MATRWHFRDTRKILRSIKVLFETGKRHSELIREQQEEQQRQNEKTRDDAVDETRVIIFNITCDRQILNRRLDLRVEKMIDNGLLREIVELRSIARKRESQTDYTRGIFQAIGYKEFDAYLQHHERSVGGEASESSSLRPALDDEVGVKLFNQAIEEMKISTRQFAKRQVGWVRNMLLPELARRRNERVHFYSLNATDLNEWESNVRQKAVHLTDLFLSDKLPKSKHGVGEGSRNVHVDEEDDKKFRVCEVCTTDASLPCMILNSKWDLHCKGRPHQTAWRLSQGIRRVEMTGPEVEANRRERQQRREAQPTSV